LFHRERRFTHLTELGRMMLPHLTDIYNAAMATQRLARDYTISAAPPFDWES